MSFFFFLENWPKERLWKKISLKLNIILNLKRQTSGRHFEPVIKSFDGMFNRVLFINPFTVAPAKTGRTILHFSL